MRASRSRAEKVDALVARSLSSCLVFRFAEALGEAFGEAFFGGVFAGGAAGVVDDVMGSVTFEVWRYVA